MRRQQIASIIRRETRCLHRTRTIVLRRIWDPMKKLATVLSIACLILLGSSRAFARPIVLHVEDLSSPGGTDLFVGAYQHLGFTLSNATQPGGVNAGFLAHGTASVF